MSSKVARYISYLLFRLLLPIVLLAGCALRYNLVSFLYLLFLLGLPLIPAPSAVTVKGVTGVYLILLIVLGGLATLAHAVFHIVLAAIPEPYGYSFSNCSSNEKIARLIAVERLDGVPFIHILRLVVLDVVVLVVAILVFIVCYKVFSPSRDTLSSEEVPSSQSITRRRRASRLHNFLLFVGKFIDVLFLAACGIIVPSLASAAYFLSFLYIATWWSLYRGLGKKFSIFRICVLIWSGLHLLFLHLYQMQLFQEDWFPSRTSLWARILGLTAVIKTDCGKPWSVEFHEPSNWPLFVNPPLLLALYISVATETRYWRTSKREDVVDAETSSPKKKRRRNPKPSEREVLPQHDGQDESLVTAGENQSYETFSGEPPRQRNKDESPTMLDSDEEDGGSTHSKPKKTKPHVKRSPVVSLFVYIMKQSYVLSLIAMMAWSITYHSWLTFVLLLAACFIWMVPQSRKACLLCSPAVVLYGEVLLIIQFVYGMNLTELPEESNGIKLDEIGLKKFKYPCLQLALQILFTSMFWLTMRQFIRERQLTGSSDNSQVPMETLSSEGCHPAPGSASYTEGWIRLREMSDGEEDVWDITQSPKYIPSLDQVDGYDGQTVRHIGHSEAVRTIGLYLWNLLSKYWIFVCTGMMLLISIQEVVVYRIIYLILFLLFMLTFQMSYTLWRASMYVFWWVIIIYSMGVLIILYTYQFQDFPSYWQNNTGLSDKILSDIGLEQFNTATLFVKLLTPTSFLILIILQVHYFHTTFLRLSDIKQVKTEDQKDEQPATNTMTDTAGETTDSEPPIIKKGLRKKVKLHILTVWHKCSEVWAEVSTVLWRVLEVHFVKVVLFTIFMVCVSELSAIGGVFVIILGVFMPLTRGWTVMLHVCRIWVSIAMVAKMIYQLSIIDKEYWNSNCTITNDAVNSSTTPAPVTNITNLTDLLPAEIVINPFGNGTVNNAKWVGLDKEGVLSYYLRNYILILVVLIFERVIFYRQARRRLYTGITDIPKGVIFSGTNRKNADKNLLSCAKYFANYFFYKFGLEICYIMMATVICVRVDAYSVLYSICLGTLLLLSRQRNALVWPIFTIILTVLLPIQYILCLGFPPGACIEYPWKFTTETDKNLETWLYLPSYFDPPDVNKLIGDFFLLLFVCLQWQVFRTEAHVRSDASLSYGGGSNGDILEEVEANRPIPVEDFTTIHESYLDVVKSGFFSYMYWVTLYIIFLAGTTRINLFSMGYIIGALCFMWYGQEFILKPLRKIRKSWNTFLGYTFIVIFLKASLQLLGCVYIDYLYDNQCWLIQLLGLTCLSPSRTYSPGSGGYDCKVEKDDSGLSWDVVCFTFLLLQLRIYNSHYFRHIIASAEAQNALAARGAELINHRLVTRVQEQREDERKVLENIKKKMEILRRKRIQGSNKAFTEPDEHFQAIRSGDYYLFEDESEAHTEDLTSITIGVDSEEEKDDDKADPLRLISTAIESGARAAVEQAENEDEEGEETEEKEDKSDSKLEKITNILKLIKMLLESLVDWTIEKFNRVSNNYRMVARTLEEEMKAQKALIQRNKTVPVITDTRVNLQVEDEGKEGASGERVDFTDISIVDMEAPDGDILDGNVQSKPSTKFENKKNKVYLLLEATYYALVSRSELVCYFLMILNQILYCSLLSLPLPLMVFLWGMLSVPRPSKMFWITAITYTEAVVVIKYLFQFGFFSWNNNTDIETDPFWPPRIIGIEKKDGFVTADLILLLALFIHRSILKRYGLWKDAEATMADVDRAEEMISAPTTPIQEEGARSFESSVTNNSKEAQAGSSTSQESDGDGEGGPGLQMVLEPFKKFYSQLTDPKYNATTDVYATMFFCDFINFLILVFGYWAFGPEQTSGGDNVTEYISEDRIPVPFLIMLVTQFILIVIDRALYLRKNILGKFIFQILLVILIHVWLFFVLPYVTKRKFSENVPAQMFYFFKCLYFGLSAYQIRSSYPTRILGNFLTKKYNYINLFLFKGFLAIPFLLELRVLMDWIWTDSTLAIGSWLQMEDIYANIYVLKCWREAERNYPTPRSQKKGSLIKYGVGGLLLVLIIFIIWFPLVIFSFANTVYINNPPVGVTASIAIGGFQPLFKVQAQQQSIASLTTAQYNDLLTYFNEREMKSAVSTLNKFEPQDITIIKLNGKSTSVWGISPPSKLELIQFLNNTAGAKIEFETTFTRKPTASDASPSLTSHLMDVLDDVTRTKLIQLLREPETSAPVEVKNLFSRFFRLSKKTLSDLNFIPKSNVSMHLSVTNVSEWWNVNETLSPGVLCPEPQDKKCGPSATELTLITLNDRAAPAGFSLISGYGIIGLYVTFILLIGRILRLSTTGLAERITYLELPYVDNILQLCLDVYLVREMHEFRLEEDLYAKLIFVYRSSETRIKWTRLPKDLIITDAKKND